MAESYSEDLIRVKRGTVTMLRFVGAVLSLTCGLSVISVSIMLMPLLVALWIFAFWLLKPQALEYEYIFTTGSLEIDKIVNMSRRKHVMTIDFKAVQVIAPYNSDQIKQAKENEAKTKVKNFTSQREDARVYSVLVNKNGNFMEILIEPSDKTLELMKQYGHRKVFL
ncbi:MAG: hypothetical protein IJA10_15520 [Lachnospiraceae bacterium]|nr:hypothetical protein [Lachnospiraceae bacterium]